jgi:hypothetical protein
MTVIVVHKGVIAADSLLSCNQELYALEPHCKFGLLDNGDVYAGAGEMHWVQAAVDYRNGARAGAPTTHQNAAYLATMSEGTWTLVGSDSDYPRRCGNTWAIGTGDGYANSALILGHDAITAVWCAMQLSTSCGGVIFHASLDELVRVGNGAIKQTDPHEFGKRYPAIAEAQAEEAARAVQSRAMPRRTRATPSRGDRRSRV